MILCCGEALIDLLPRETRDGALAFQPFNGGSIFNTAIALGRLGVPTRFLGGLSTDFFGDQLRAGFKASNVDHSLSPSFDRYTITAFVKFDGVHARYVFIDEGSASRSLSAADIPPLPADVAGLHVGSISLIPEPCGGAIEGLALKEGRNRVISLDPNIRAGLVRDKPAHIARLKRVAAVADVMKLSDEDLQWIAPGAAEEDFVKDWLALGASVVIVTRGGEGAKAYTKRFAVTTAPVVVKVADTVGAGDTFTAGTLTSLVRQGIYSKSDIAAISQDALQAAIAFAARAAAITCSRPGADPPWARELEA
jgi:fructokinase